MSNPIPTFDVLDPNIEAREDQISAWLAEFERFYARTNPHIPSVEEQLQNEHSPYYVGPVRPVQLIITPNLPLFTIRE